MQPELNLGRNFFRLQNNMSSMCAATKRLYISMLPFLHHCLLNLANLAGTVVRDLAGFQKT